jgi:hypothetical protein
MTMNPSDDKYRLEVQWVVSVGKVHVWRLFPATPRFRRMIDLRMGSRDSNNSVVTYVADRAKDAVFGSNAPVQLGPSGLQAGQVPGILTQRTITSNARSFLGALDPMESISFADGHKQGLWSPYTHYGEAEKVATRFLCQ